MDIARDQHFAEKVFSAGTALTANWKKYFCMRRSMITLHSQVKAGKRDKHRSPIRNSFFVVSFFSRFNCRVRIMIAFCSVLCKFHYSSTIVLVFVFTSVAWTYLSFDHMVAFSLVVDGELDQIFCDAVLLTPSFSSCSHHRTCVLCFHPQFAFQDECF